MSEMSPGAIGAMAAGLLVTLAFAGFVVTQENEATNVGNLPATNANVQRNADDIKANEAAARDALDKATQRLAAQISAATQRLSEQITAEIQLVRAEINRRELETTKYIDTLDLKKLQRIGKLETRLNKDVRELRARLMEHINHPPSSHGRGP